MFLLNTLEAHTNTFGIRAAHTWTLNTQLQLDWLWYYYDYRCCCCCCRCRFPACQKRKTFCEKGRYFDVLSVHMHRQPFVRASVCVCMRRVYERLRPDFVFVHFLCVISPIITRLNCVLLCASLSANVCVFCCCFSFLLFLLVCVWMCTSVYVWCHSQSNFMFRAVIRGNSAPHEHLTLILGFEYKSSQRQEQQQQRDDDDDSDDNNIMQNYMLLNCFGRDLIRFSRLLQLPVYWHKLHVTILSLSLPLWWDSFESHLFAMRHEVNASLLQYHFNHCKTTKIYQSKQRNGIHLTRVHTSTYQT